VPAADGAHRRLAFAYQPPPAPIWQAEFAYMFPHSACGSDTRARNRVADLSGTFLGQDQASKREPTNDGGSETATTPIESGTILDAATADRQRVLRRL